ncbi:MAG: ABC-2 transporter permease [Ignavibacteriales bacterium]|nr:ABC-2 transporter permease [Ignavibacteriales bacterium]
MMILQLILKDIRAYGSLIFLWILLPMAILNSLFSLRFYPVGGFIIAGCMVIAVACSILSFSEKKKNIEILTRSLPVTISEIVIARFLTSVTISIIGMIFYYIGTYIVNQIYINPKTNFENINSPKVLFIATFYLLLHNALFIPVMLKFRFLGSILAFVIAMFATILITVSIFKPYRLDFNPYFGTNDSILISTLTLFAILILVIAFTISLFVYKRKEF